MSESFVGFVGTPPTMFWKLLFYIHQKHGRGMPTKPTKLCSMQAPLHRYNGK